METNYIEIFENFKKSICNYLSGNIMNCSESVMESCLVFIQNEFTDQQRYDIGKHLMDHFKLNTTTIISNDFSYFGSIIVMAGSVKHDILG